MIVMYFFPSQICNQDMWNVPDIALDMGVLVPYIVPEASPIHHGLDNITLNHIGPSTQQWYRTEETS
jgi:hypothetical protein